jgi:hypothetical protein
MSDAIQIDFNGIEPITIELPDAFPPVFTVEFESGLLIEANFGIPGPKGDKGDTGDITQSSIGDLDDVVLTNLQEGDILLYQSTKFVNQPKTVLVDGGNF